MLKSEFISDVVLELTQGAPSDDSELSESQIAYLGTIHLNNLIKGEIESELKKGHQVPPIYITQQNCEPLSTEDLECQSDNVDRIYITLDNDILDLQNDSGVVRVITDEGDEVRQITLDFLNSIKNMRFAKPSMTNPAIYRQGPRTLYVEGIKPAELPFNFLTVFYVKKQDIQSLSDSDEIVVSDLVKPLLIANVVDQLKAQMYGTQPDINNDGVSYNQPVYHQAIQSVSNQ